MTPGYKTFLFEYHHAGSRWVVEMPATDEADAQERMNKLPLAKLLGTVEMKIPAGIPGAGWFVRFLCWWHNLWGAK